MRPEIETIAERLERTTRGMNTRKRDDYLAGITVAEAVKAATALRALLAERDRQSADIESLRWTLDWVKTASLVTQDQFVGQGPAFVLRRLGQIHAEVCTALADPINTQGGK